MYLEKQSHVKILFINSIQLTLFFKFAIQKTIPFLILMGIFINPAHILPFMA